MQRRIAFAQVAPKYRQDRTPFMRKLGLALIMLLSLIGLGTRSAQAESPLCKKFHDSLVTRQDGMAESEFETQDMEALTINIGNAPIGNMPLSVEVKGVLIDIENRGVPDRVLIDDQMMRGTDLYNDLYVFRVDPFGSKTDITVQSFDEITDNGMAVELYGGDGPLARPYGITIPALSLLTIGRKNYVMVQQNAVSQTPPLALLAVYSASSQGNASSRGNLKILCAVRAPVGLL